jgi:hypothetical protein
MNPRGTAEPAAVASVGPLSDIRSQTLFLRVGGRLFAIDCECEQTRGLIETVFSALVCPAPAGERPCRRYNVIGPDPSGQFAIEDETGSRSTDALDVLIYRIDKKITIALQLERPDLFFLHAAAVSVNGRVVAMPAFPGTGKSTLTLALVENGLEYLSDELAPVDPRSLTVEPYPHAVCLKSPPPEPYALPRGTVHVNRRWHVPVESLATTTRRDPLPLTAIAFLRRDGTRFRGLRPLTAASAATCLMAHVLNGLAHQHYGLDAAISLSRAVPCFELDVTDLPAAVREIAAL